MAAKIKLTAYVNPRFADEIQAEAVRLDRSVSWLLEHAWRISRTQVVAYESPSHEPRTAA